MPTLTIEGRDVEVDQGFLSLSPQDQERSVQEIADQLKIQPQQQAASPAGNSGGGQQTYGGVGMNTTGGLNDVLYGIAGAPVDATRWAINKGISGINAVTGSELEQLPSDYGLGSQKIGQAMGEIHPAMNPQNTIASTPEERIARSTGQGIAATVLPAGAVGAMTRAGTMGPQAAQMATRAFGSGASVGEVGTLATVGGAGGAGAGAGVEMAPEGYEGLAALGGGLVGGGIGALASATPSAIRAGTQQLARYAEPLYPAGQRQMAGRQLRESATAPYAAMDALETPPRELVPGSLPTTGQVTGDMGLLAAERGAATRSPETFMQRRADQNTARLGALEPIAGQGAPERVSQTLRTRLQQIDDETMAAFTQAQEGARTSASAVGVPVQPEDAGGSMRASLEAARSAAKDRERQLWQTVDPDNSLALQANSTRQQVASIIKELPGSAKPPAGEEAAIFDVVRGYGDVVPFGEITALQSRVKSALREERMTNGESPAYRRMSQMSSALQRDLETAVAGKISAEERAVAAGQMNPEDTVAVRLEANLATARDRWSEQRTVAALGEAGGAIGSQRSGVGTAGLPGFSGAGRQNAGGFSGTARDPRVPRQPEPNFDQAALDRLSLANRATRERVETFDNKTLGPIRRRPGASSPYDMPAASVPSRIFFPQPRSGEAIRTYRQAVGDAQAMRDLEGYAVDQLRRSALRDDGVLDAAKVSRWRDQHRDALENFPDLNRRLSNAERAAETMSTVEGNRRVQVDAFQKGTVGRLMGVEDPADVTRIVGSIFSRQDAVQQMTNLRQSLEPNPEGMAGLKKSVAEFMTNRLVSNAEAGTSGRGALKGDQLQSFVRDNKAALRTIFAEDEVATIEAVAMDIQRSSRSQNAVRIPGQSNTAQDTNAAGEGGLSVLTRLITTAGAAGGGAGMATNSMSGVTIAGGTLVATALREVGVRTVGQLVQDALLNPDLAKALMQSVKPGRARDTSRSILKAYRSNALTSSSSAADWMPEDESKATHQQVAEALLSSGNGMGPIRSPGIDRVAQALMQQRQGSVVAY